MKLVKCANCEFKYDIRKQDRCPECGVHYIARKALPKTYDLGYPQCSWEAGGLRCKFPGTLTSSTLADNTTQWFCSAHFECHDPVAGSDIVEASHDYAHRTPGNGQSEAATYRAERGLDTVQQMRAWCRKRIATIGKHKQPETA